MNAGSQPNGAHLPNGINPSMCMYQVSGTRRVSSPGCCFPRACPILFLLLCEPFSPAAYCNVSDPIGMGFGLDCLKKPFFGVTWAYQ